MKLILMPPNSGKSDAIIRECYRLESEIHAKRIPGAYYILAATHVDAVRLQKRGDEIGCPIRMPLSASARDERTGRYVIGILIDDVDRVLPMLLGRPVLAASMTDETRTLLPHNFPSVPGKPA